MLILRNIILFLDVFNKISYKFRDNYTQRESSMLHTIKKVSFLWALALTLTFGHATLAMDEQDARDTTGAPVSSSSASSTQTMDDLIAQDPIKKFAFQAKNLAEESKNECPCVMCSCFSMKSNALWELVKDADTASPEVKEHMMAYANHDHAFDRLSQDMQTWLSEQGYRTGSDAPLGLLDILFGMMLLNSQTGPNLIKIYVPKDFFDDEDSSK